MKSDINGRTLLAPMPSDDAHQKEASLELSLHQEQVRILEQRFDHFRSWESLLCCLECLAALIGQTFCCILE